MDLCPRSPLARPLLVGLGHRRRVGKSTAAKFLVDHYGFTELSFAYPIKCVVHDALGVSWSRMDGPEKERRIEFGEDSFIAGYTPRELMGQVGEMFMRKIDPSIWVNRVKRDCQKLLHDSANIVVSDVRTPAEAIMVRELGGTLLRINRDIPANPQHDNAPTEMSLKASKYWDHEIQNHGTFDNLYFSVTKALRLGRA